MQAPTTQATARAISGVDSRTSRALPGFGNACRDFRWAGFQSPGNLTATAMNPLISPDAPTRDVPGILVAWVALVALFSWSWWRRRRGRSSLAPSIVWLMAGVLCLGFAVVVSAKLGSAKGNSSAAARWPVVTGVVVRSVVRTLQPGSMNRWNAATRGSGIGIRFDNDRYLDLLYRYEVDGRRHEGSMVTPGNFRVGDQEEVLARRFPEGARVQVHYNPADPSDAVLDPVAVHPGDASMPWKLVPVAIGLFALAWWDGRARVVTQLDEEPE